MTARIDRGQVRALRRIAATVCAALAITGLAGCSMLTPSRADVVPDATRTKLSAPTIAKKGVLTVGLEASDAPQTMTDSTGRLTGYTADVARALGRKLGLKVAFDTDHDPSAAGSSGGPDIYLGALKADATDQVAVTGTFLEDAPALFGSSKSGSSAAGAGLTADSLAQATIAVQQGSKTAELLTQTGITATQKPYGNVNDCFKALAAGEVQYVACDATSGAYLARAYPGVALAATFDAATSYGFASRTTNATLTKAVSDALDELAKDGTLDAIHTAWYGSLPSSLSDSMVSGISTSAEREKAAAEKKAQEDAEKKQAEEAAAQNGSTSGSASDSTSDASDSSAQ